MENLNQQVLNALSASPQVIVWGTGQLAMKMLSDTVLKDARVIAFVDSNPIHSNKRIRGIPIVLPHEIPSGDWPIIVTSLLHSDGILGVIRNLGLANPVVVLRPHEQSRSTADHLARPTT
jgi:hypothetical protein